MVAFNFMEQFADDVEAGRKLQSARLTQRCNVGDKIQLYTGQRTKKCRKLGDGVCTAVKPINIQDRFMTKEEIKFAKNDGFKNIADMKAFFRKTHGVPVDLFIHKWRLI